MLTSSTRRFHATIRCYVEHHIEPIAILILGKYRRLDGTVPIFVAAESSAFPDRFGPIAARYPSGSFPLGDDSALGPLVRSSQLAVDPPQLEIPLNELSGASKKFVAEAFFNTRCYFLTFAPATRLRRGRRIKVATG